METEHAPAFALIAFSDGKPVSTPDQVRGRHFPENALAASLAAAALSPRPPELIDGEHRFPLLV